MDELLIVYFTNFHEHEVMDVCHLIQIDGLERYSQQHIAKSDSTRTLPWHIYIYIYIYMHVVTNDPAYLSH
jgi:hypothetical protein